MDDRIKLAEAMGLTVAPVTLEDCGGPFLVTSDSTLTTSDELVAEWVEWNPFTDANDCEALIHHITKDGYFRVTMTIGNDQSIVPKDGVRFDHYNGTKKEWEGDDWKQGVCELALKVLERMVVIPIGLDCRKPGQRDPWGHVWYVWNWDAGTLEFDPSNGEWSEKK